jgi:outer membrane protein TolC
MILLCLLLQEPLSWSELSALLRQSPAMEAERASAAMAAGTARLARSAYLPQIHLDSALSSTNQPVAVFAQRLAGQEFAISDFIRPASDGGMDPYPVNHPTADEDWFLRLDAAMTLFDRSRGPRVQAAAASLAATELAERQRWQDTLLEYALRRSQLFGWERSSQLMQQMVQHSRSMEEILAALVEEGQIARLAFLEAQQARLETEARAAEIAGELRARQAAMELWLDAVPGSRFPHLEAPPLQPRATPAGVEAASLLSRSFQTASKAEQPGWMPSLRLQATLERHQSADVFHGVALSMRLAVFDGGQSKQKRAIAEAAASRAQALEEQLRRGYEEASRQQEEELAGLQGSSAALNEALVLVRSRWTLEKALVEEGQMEQVRWVETHARWTQLEVQAVETQTRLALASWRRAHAAGQDLEKLISGGKP